MTELGDLLAAAGYSSGDFLVLPGHDVGSDQNLSGTSTSYIDDNRYHIWDVTWSDVFPSGVQGGLYLSVRLNPGSGNTCDIRIQNLVDGETVTEMTGISSTDTYSLGPVAYTPTTTNSRIDIRLQIKRTSGSSTFNSEWVTGGFAIQL